MRYLIVVVTLALLAACGSQAPVSRQRIPTVVPPPRPSAAVVSLRTQLNGVWHTDDPPWDLIIDVDGGEITSKLNGMQTTDPFTIVGAQGKTVTLKWTKTGRTVDVRFISDDVFKLSDKAVFLRVK